MDLDNGKTERRTNMEVENSEEYREYIKEKITDGRHIEDIGLGFIAAGAALLSASDRGIGMIVAGALMFATGLSLFILGGRSKHKHEQALLKAKEPRK